MIEAEHILLRNTLKDPFDDRFAFVYDRCVIFIRNGRCSFFPFSNHAKPFRLLTAVLLKHEFIIFQLHGMIICKFFYLSQCLFSAKYLLIFFFFECLKGIVELHSFSSIFCKRKK